MATLGMIGKVTPNVYGIVYYGKLDAKKLIIPESLYFFTWVHIIDFWVYRTLGHREGHQGHQSQNFQRHIINIIAEDQ